MTSTSRSTVAALTAIALLGCGGEAPQSAADDVPVQAAADLKTSAALPDTLPIGTVCGDPSAPCPGFRPHDLSFVLPADEVARAEVRSDTFYAVILRSAARCSITEAQRQEAQRALPNQKVFAQRTMCEDDIANNVSYTAVNDTVAFLAVHAGPHRPGADSVLASVRATGAFPGANLRRMQAVFMYP
jgi:hypothetical protein